MNRIMGMIPNGVSTKIGRTILHTQKGSPTILFAVGVVGVVATAVAASRATMHLSDTLEEARRDLELAEKTLVSETVEYTEMEYRKDVTVIYAKAAGQVVRLYGPSILIGVCSVAALTGSHRILVRRNLALTAAYSALDRGFREYRARVREVYGNDIDRYLRHGVERYEIETKDEAGIGKTDYALRAPVVPNDYSIYARFFDPLCREWSPIPEYNRIFLHGRQNQANDLLTSRGHVFLNEVYDSLGIERAPFGQVVGWLKNGDGDGFIDFGIFYGERDKVRDFVNGREGSILLDFNVDGVIYDKI